MERMKNIINDRFEVMRNRNPNNTTGNLVAGALILVLLAVFSVWYFGDEGGSEGLQNLFTGEQGEEMMVEEETANTVTVEAGEGLWQIAERVCGDGELYNEVAAENGLSVWAQIAVGQELTVSCEY